MEKRYIPGAEFGAVSSRPLKQIRLPLYLGIFLLVMGLPILFYQSARIWGVLLMAVGIILMVFAILRFKKMLAKSHLLGSSAGKTYLLLQEHTLCGASFSTEDLKAGCTEFEIAYGDIRTVRAKSMDPAREDYTTLILETAEAQYRTAVDNSEEAAREIEARMRQAAQ